MTWTATAGANPGTGRTRQRCALLQICTHPIANRINIQTDPAHSRSNSSCVHNNIMPEQNLASAVDLKMPHPLYARSKTKKAANAAHGAASQAWPLQYLQGETTVPDECYSGGRTRTYGLSTPSAISNNRPSGRKQKLSEQQCRKRARKSSFAATGKCRPPKSRKWGRISMKNIHHSDVLGEMM